uniref:hemagglutinin repeat-containing protein n=1 Tax=Gilliamella sp. Nev6-6 TaxID=3120252 RepID=UPI000A6D1C61
SVNIRAGKDVNIKGSEVIAQRDIKLQGENVNIEALDAKTTYKEEYKHQKSGLTVAVTGTVSDMYNANQTREQAKKQTNEKTKALMNIKAGLQAGNAALETGANLQNGVPEASIGINLSLGSEKTKRTVNQEQHTVVSSGISAGHNVSIIATGNGQKESGDINIIGSQVSAGHDAMLKANHDVNIVGQENTSKTDTKEKSSSGSVGVGYNFGGQKNGFNISANASHSKSREKGNGTDWTESVVEAGNKLTIITGNDANIIAGQVKGDRVVADIGHDLNIESKQDSDEFHSKSTSASAGGSISMGGGGSANASASKTKMDSNWQSVTDQSGIFAGKGGFDIKVGNNTDLKGAVISSEAEDPSKNRLDTGTISFSDIENKADYKVSSSSAGISSSGMPSMPTSRNKSEKANSTTQSAVSEGTIIIRNKDGQQQDIDDLSRDTEQASNELKHIFSKEKEQDIIDQTRLVSEIGGETLTMLNHIDRISAESAANKKLKEEQKKAKEQGLVLTDEQEQKIYEKAYNNAMNEGMSAMGSDTRQGVEMAVNIINGLITGDMTGAVAGALAPKIATIIKQQTEGNTVANTISHAILGAVVAELQGNSALAGGLGAAASERSAEVIAGILYPDKAVTELSQEERQKISALSQLATGLAIAASGGDIQDMNTGIAAGKNAVENNLLSNKSGVEKLDKESKKLYEKIKDIVGYDEVDKLQQQYNDCKTEECKANVYNQYIQKEQEAGRRLVDLYKTGKLSEDEYYQLVTWYSDTMLEGIKQSQIDNSKNHSFVDWDINDASAWDWTASNIINNPYLNEIRSLILLDKWRSEGLSESEIQERFIKNGILDSFGSGPEVNKIIHQVRNGGLSLEDGLKLASAAAFSKFTDKTAGAAGKVADDNYSRIVPGGSLSAHEAAGGHLIARHVGKTEQELLDRVSTGNVKTASSFTDRAIAESVTSKAIEANQSKIDAYLAGNQKGYLEIEYKSSSPIGISVSKGQTNVSKVSNARIIIARDSSMPNGYRIVTGYPTP